MISTPLTILAGFLFRLGTILLDSAPYLLLSACAVGLIRGIFGTHRFLALLQGPSSHPMRLAIRAALLGFLIPICALSLLPLLHFLQLAGTRRTSLLAFAFAAAVFHPATLAYALATFDLATFLLLVLGALLIAIAGALFAHQFDPYTPTSLSHTSLPEPLQPTSALRLLAACHHAAHAWNPQVLRLAFLGLIPAALVSALLSPGILAESFFRDDPRAVPRMLAIAPAIYSTPEKAITALPYMRIFDQAPGAALLFISLGAGLTLAHIPWLIRYAGPRSLATVLLPTLLVAFILATAAPLAIPSIGSPNPDNDHLNPVANPFSDELTHAELARAFNRLLQNTEPTRWFALLAFTLLATLGRLIPAPPAPRPESPAIPAANTLHPTLARAFQRFALLIPLLALAISALFIYFPAPSEIFAEIQEARANAYSELSNPSPQASLAQLDRWNRLAGKLPVAALLRGRPATSQPAQTVTEMQKRIQHVIQLVRAKQTDEARQALLNLNDLHTRCQAFYLNRP